MFRPGYCGALLIACFVFTSGTAHGSVTWDSDSQDVTAALTDTTATVQFPFSNTETFPWTVISVSSPSDVDTFFDQTSKTYRPGDDGLLTATIDTTRMLGDVTRTLTVRTDHVVDPYTYLTITIHVPNPLDISASSLIWHSTESSTTKSVLFEANSPLDVHLTGVSTFIPIPPGAGWTYELITIEPGRQYQLNVTPPADRQDVSGQNLRVAHDLPGSRPPFSIGAFAFPLIPEPGTGLMFTLGFMAAASRRR